MTPTPNPKALESAARALALQASVSEMEAHGYNGIHAREYADEWWRSHLDRARAAISAHIAAAPDLLEIVRELDRLGLVIESAVRADQPPYDDQITDLIDRARDAIAKVDGKP